MNQPWLFYAIAAPILWACVDILDKVLISKYGLKPSIFTFLLGISGIIAAAVIFFVHEEIDYSFDIVLLSGISGIVILLFIFLFFKALELSDAPVVVAMLSMSSLLSVLWGYLFFHEILTSTQYLGIFVVLVCIALLNMEASVVSPNQTIGPPKTFLQNRLSLSKALLLMFPASLLASIVAAIEKHLTNSTSVYSVFFWERIGAFLFTAILFLLFRAPLTREIKAIRSKVQVVIAIDMLSLLAFFCLLLALSLGPLSLVMVIGATTPAFVMFFVYFTETIRPGTIPDLASKQRLLKRVLIISGTISGSYLLL
uniref:Uncharacterized membrane protein n=1 Tax=Candidatus Kentrum sp. FW TaxID=2126338 RepID=A0A450TH56_9GAMM|nr:MAG: Uncharacterized membrane protein [Candidatus Kentron sp. FW]